MIVLFLVDTSASMNQKTSFGMTLLDCAKAAIEHFLVRNRHRDQSQQQQTRYFLVTLEEGIGAIKVGWRDSFSTFLDEVKNLSSKDLSNLGLGLKRSFDLLNQFRLSTSIDNYGCGRNPWFSEPAVIVLLTDNGKLTSLNDVKTEVKLPMTPSLPGSELTSEPFRWDQRLYTIVLRFPGAYGSQFGSFGNRDAPSSPPITFLMSEVTGGKCYIANTMKDLFQSVTEICAKLQPGVVVSFETDSATNCPHRMIFTTTKHGGHFPIPESFLPDEKMEKLAPRSAHPVIRYVAVDQDPTIMPQFPFDKYELEGSPLTTAILQRQQQSQKEFCWHVFVQNSAGPQRDLGEPFGFLKPSRSGHVHLILLPYAFPRLFPLLQKMIGKHVVASGKMWRGEFDKYLQSIPSYYIPNLRNALKKMGLNLIPDHADVALSFSVKQHLKNLKKQTEQQNEKTLASLQQVKEKQQQRQQQSETQYRPFENKEERPAPTTNPFDTTRDLLFPHLSILRDQILYPSHYSKKKRKLSEIDESKVTVPISEMGNYQEALAKKQILRRIDDEEGADNLKKAYFGNPYKQGGGRQGPRMAIDEADEIGGGDLMGTRRVGRKRSIMSLPDNYTLIAAQQKNQDLKDTPSSPFSLSFPSSLPTPDSSYGPGGGLLPTPASPPSTPDSPIQMTPSSPLPSPPSPKKSSSSETKSDLSVQPSPPPSSPPPSRSTPLPSPSLPVPSSHSSLTPSSSPTPKPLPTPSTSSISLSSSPNSPPPSSLSNPANPSSTGSNQNLFSFNQTGSPVQSPSSPPFSLSNSYFPSNSPVSQPEQNKEKEKEEGQTAEPGLTWLPAIMSGMASSLNKPETSKPQKRPLKRARRGGSSLSNSSFSPSLSSSRHSEGKRSGIMHNSGNLLGVGSGGMVLDDLKKYEGNGFSSIEEMKMIIMKMIRTSSGGVRLSLLLEQIQTCMIATKGLNVAIVVDLMSYAISFKRQAFVEMLGGVRHQLDGNGRKK